jgi:hypothetical protein
LNTLPVIARHSENSQLTFLFDAEWPPAISASHIKFFARSYSCLVDNFGKVVTADLRRPGHYKALGVLSDIGKRVLDFAVWEKYGYALILKESESGDLQTAVSLIDLSTPDSPSLLSQHDLTEFNSLHSIVAENGYICIAGTAPNGHDLISVYRLRTSKSDPPTLKLIKSLSPASPLQKIVLVHGVLFMLESEKMKSVIYQIDITSGDLVPKQVTTLEGEFTAAAVSGNLILAGGHTGKGLEIIVVNLLPSPHQMCKQTLGNAQVLYDMITHRNDFLLLLERDSNLNLVSVAVDKSLSLDVADDVAVTKFAADSDTKAEIDVSGQYANVVTGAESVRVLTQRAASWVSEAPFTTPALPISAVSFWGNYLITAGVGLSLYDIAQPRRTHKVTTTKTEGAVHDIAVAGSYLLCQTRDALSLRKVGEINKVITTAKIAGQRMIYDDGSNTAYIVDRQAKSTTVTPVHVYSNKLAADKPFVLQGTYASIAAFEAQFVLGGANEVGLYEFGDSSELVGSHKFPNHVVRAVSANNEYLLIAAVDHDLIGQLMILSPESLNGSLELISTLELPQDACALTAVGSKVLVIGQSPKGQSVLSVIRMDDPSQPKIEDTVEILAQASAITVQDKLAVIAGRGLQILSI